jgi:hypothetical protein
MDSDQCQQPWFDSVNNKNHKSYTGNIERNQYWYCNDNDNNNNN